MKVKQKAENRHDLVDDIFVSRAGTAREDDPISHVIGLCELISRPYTGDRRVQKYAEPSVKVLLAKETARGAAARRVGKGSLGCESSSISASERSGQEDVAGRTKVWKEEGTYCTLRSKVMGA